MKSSKVIDIFKDGNIIIPIYLLKNYKKFDISYNEFVFLMYLYNKGDNIAFNPDSISSDLGISVPEVMECISVLSDKNLIKLDVKKHEKGFMEDIIVLDGFYDKIKLLIVDDSNNNSDDKSDDGTIYEIIEKEFGRTLSPIEYEIIKAWLDSNISFELIKEAVKEATFNGVSNLKYIDKILYEWKKKNIKSAKDVEENRKKRKSSNEENIDLDIVDWNWFDDE